MCLAFIAFSLPLFAQNLAAQTTQDTLQIRFQGRNQVFIIGKSLKSLTAYHRADSLKSLFFADLKKSVESGTFSEIPKRIHYFVNQQGKRRLKAEVNEDAAAKFDLQHEKNRMVLDLPPLHYTIYDLPQAVELHFFLEDSTVFEAAVATELKPALQRLEKDRKKLTGLTAYKVEKNGFGYESRNPKPKSWISVEVVPAAGGMLLGNQPSPLISYDIFLSMPGQFIRSNDLRLGFSYNAFVLTEFSNGQFRKINPGEFWHGSLQFNYQKEKSGWFGVSAGQLDNTHANGLKNNAFKWGLISTYGPNILGIDIVHLSRKTQLLMLTFKRSFI